MNGLTIDTERRIVRLHGKLVELSRQEYKLLTKLYEDPERAWERHELIQHLWDMPWCEAPPESRLVDTLAHRLRKKLGPGFIVNVWGFGYRLVQPAEVADAA